MVQVGLKRLGIDTLTPSPKISSNSVNEIIKKVPGSGLGGTVRLWDDLHEVVPIINKMVPGRYNPSKTPI